MSQTPIRFGIIGVGFIGRAHARCCQDIDGIHLMAVADLDKARSQAAAKDFGVEGYEDYKQLLARQDIDAVVVCLPDHLHVKPCLAAAQAGKHVLLEKPLASTLADADQILKAAEAHKCRLMVAHSLRFNLQYAAFRERVRRGDVGLPVHGWVRRNARIIDGRRFQGKTSVILFLAIHDIDFLRWCVGSEVVRVFAMSNRQVLKDVGVDDSVLSVLKFANGFVASMEHSWINPEKFPAVVDAKAEIVGAKGVISVDAFSHGLTAWTDSGPNFSPPSEFLGEVRSSLYEELRHYANCLRCDKDFLVSNHDAYEDLRVALAIHESVEKGTPVDLL